MSNRAKRLRTALEALGWDCDDSYYAPSRHCGSCDNVVSDKQAKHCDQCGAKLPEAKVEKVRSTAVQLEVALQYALGEVKKIPST